MRGSSPLLGSLSVTFVAAARRHRRHELKIPAPALRCSRPGEAEQAAEIAQGLITAAGKLLSRRSFFNRGQELRDHRRKPQMESCPPCCQPSPSRPAVVSFSCQRGQAQEAPDANRRPFPGSRKASDKPSDNAPRQYQTGGDAPRDTDIWLTCGNPTQPDDIRRDRHAW